MIGGAIERLTHPEAQFIDGFVDQLEVVAPEIGEQHQIADAAPPALWRAGPGDFDVTNVQSRPQAFVVYLRRVHRDPGKNYNSPDNTGSWTDRLRGPASLSPCGWHRPGGICQTKKALPYG
jgi:hypothetical protein